MSGRARFRADDRPGAPATARRSGRPARDRRATSAACRRRRSSRRCRSRATRLGMKTGISAGAAWPAPRAAGASWPTRRRRCRSRGRRASARRQTSGRSACRPRAAGSWRRGRRSRPPATARRRAPPAAPHVAQHRRLEAAEAEVEAAVALGRVAIGIGQARAGPADGAARCPSRARRSMIGPPGYPRPSSFATLSYASPAASSRVRPSSAYSPSGFDQVEAGVAARDDEHDGRQRNARRARARSTRCGRPGGARRRAACRSAHAAALANDTPTSSEPTRPGPCVTASASTSAHADAAVGQRALDDAADVAHVLARRQLRHDAAPLAVNLHLRRDDVRSIAHGCAASAVSSTRRRGGLVAGGFDAEDACRSGLRVRRAVGSPASDGASSSNGGRKMPRSVMIAGDVLARRHVERRVADLAPSAAPAAWRRRASPRARRAPRSGWPRRPASPGRWWTTARPRRTGCRAPCASTATE